MADKIVAIKFEINSADAVEDINKVTKATDGVTASTSDYEDQLNDTKKASDSFRGSSKQFEEQLKSNSKATEAAANASNSFEEQLKEIKKTIDGANVDELEDAIKQYKNIAIIAGQTSPIGREAIMEASALKDKIEDLETAVSIAQRSGTQLQGALQLGTGIAAGYGAVQGVMALVGSESEDLQKTLVKLQAVQATLASVEEIRAVLQKESAFMITATTIAEKGRAAATALATIVTNAGIMSLRAFKIALAATGIGAIVVVLIAAADAMGLFGDSADDTAKKVDKLNEATEKQNDLINKNNQAIDERTQRDILRAKIAGKTEADIIQIEKDAQTEKIKNLLNYSQQADAAFDKIRGIKEASAEQVEAAKKRSEEAYAELQKAQTERNITVLEKELELADKVREIEKAAEEKRKADLKKAADDRRAKEKEWQAELQADKDKLAEDEKTKAEKEFADMQKRALESADLFAADLAAQAATRKTYKEEELAEEIRIRDAKVQIANDLQSTLTDLGNLIINDSAKAVKFNKAMALIQIGIDTATALSKALSVTQSPSPDNVATGGLAGVAKYAGIAAMIFANAAKAKQILSSGNAAGSAPTLGGGGSAPTQAMQTQAPQTPGRISNITGSQTTTVKAIVVESDITTTQKRINSIQEIAKI